MTSKPETLISAARFALATLTDMTTEQFSRGADREVQGRLRDAIALEISPAGLLGRAATLIGESLIADSFDGETTAAFKALHDDIMAVILPGTKREVYGEDY
jgi:hypothetical protein